MNVVKDTELHEVPSQTGPDGIRPRLENYLADQIIDGTPRIVDMHRLSGGAIQENWMLNVHVNDGNWAGVHQWVLRTDSAAGVNASMSRPNEFAVLRAVHSAGVVVPKPLWLCSNKEVIGRQFFIMEAISGTASGHLLVKGGELVPNRQVLCRNLGSSLAKLHELVPPHPDLEFMDPPCPDFAGSTIRQYQKFVDEVEGIQPVIELGLQWLEINKPEPVQPRLIHRDFRTGNYMVDEGRLSGILDWEFAGWGDWREDIGWFCAPCWRFGKAEFIAGGIGDVSDFLDGYREVRDVELTKQELRYWQLMAVVRWAVIALQQGNRYLSGQEETLELALTSHMLPELELTILDLLEV